MVYLGLSPFPVIVTTRIVSCLVGDPNLNLHLPLSLGRGDNPMYVTLPPIIMVQSKMGVSPIGSLPFKYIAIFH